MHTEIRHAGIAWTEVRDDELEETVTPKQVETRAEEIDMDRSLVLNDTLTKVFHNMLYVNEANTYGTADEKKRHTEEETINAFIN